MFVDQQGWSRRAMQWLGLRRPDRIPDARGRRYGLSKSKITAFEQCPKRLWLEVHRPQEAVVDHGMQSRFAVGHAVGELACAAHPDGIMIEADPDMNAALEQTRTMLACVPPRPLFEATFRHEGVLVRVDVMTPAENGAWHVAEVKSSASAKGYHLSDLATQVWVLKGSGVNVASASVRHIDSAFVYRGDGDYRGLLKDTPADERITQALSSRAAVVSDAPLCCPAEEALDTVRLLEAIARSAASGQAVRLA